MPRKTARYGWIPDEPDYRDYLYAAPPAVLITLPSSADLRPQCPPVYDQGQLGSCTANAIAGAFQFDELKQQLAASFTPSRLFVYYNERAIEGTTGTDAGARIRDGVKSIAKQGVCPESEWPYDPAQFAKKPSAKCYRDALQNRAIQYQRVLQDLMQIKGCIASGFPVIFGFTVYDSFESQQVAQTGVVPLPAPTETVIGGHAVVAVGYDDASQRFIVRNSWGTGWGMQGYCTMPYAYLVQATLASDFWTVRLVA
ncbi:MAG TPA: C1 family peptidase [Dehalococcoidia bacterium]|nr:C1 family peptidase [Dehalococcoidia bacterium]